MSTTKYPLAALTLALNGAADLRLHLLPAGAFRAQDGRPFDCPHWVLNPVIAAAAIARSAARANQSVIDYEHQTLAAEYNGQPAPAAGWFTGLEYAPDTGLWATGVSWTEKARAHIAAGEYKYLSAVFRYDYKTGDVLEVLHAALTNSPALDGLSPVMAAKFAPHHALDMTPDQLALLGLPPAATPDAATAALKAVVDKAAAAETAIAALKTAAPDPALYVPIAALSAANAELHSLRAARAETEKTAALALVTAALADGRLLPGQKDWATDLAIHNLAALTGFLATASPIAALASQQTLGKTPPQPTASALTADELAVCKSMGLTADQYRASQEQN